MELERSVSLTSSERDLLKVSQRPQEKWHCWNKEYFLQLKTQAAVFALSLRWWHWQKEVKIQDSIKLRSFVKWKEAPNPTERTHTSKLWPIVIVITHNALWEHLNNSSQVTCGINICTKFFKNNTFSDLKKYSASNLKLATELSVNGPFVLSNTIASVDS